ncbi:MAG: HlyD family secretion protein [Gemmataceae bacterium]
MLTRAVSFVIQALMRLIRIPVQLVAGAGRLSHRLVGSFRCWVLFTLAVLLLLIVYYALADIYTPLTTDAYVQAYVVQVAPQVGEKVVRVHVDEGDYVTAGTLLFELDPALFEQKVAYLRAKLVEVEHQVKQLEAELAAARAGHERLVAEADYADTVYKQEQAIFNTDSTTVRRYLDALQKNKASQAAVRQAASEVLRLEEALNARIAGDHALVAQIKAQLAEAQLNLLYTRVHAPCDGFITDLQLLEGTYLHVGQAAMTLIDTSRWLVVANFRENSLARLRAGQPARIALRGVPGQLHDAKVSSVGWGVSQGQGVPSGQLPDVKVPASWVPPAQRFQVRLTLNEPKSIPPRVGMTGSVAVMTEPSGILNDFTELRLLLIAWMYYL